MQLVGNIGNGIVDLGANPEGLKSSKIRFSTIAGFKGLESDAVILIDGNDLSKDASDDFYVAASRAKALLVVLIRDDQRPQYGALAQTLGGRMLLEIDDEVAEPPAG
jgi:hypothetical protein